MTLAYGSPHGAGVRLAIAAGLLAWTAGMPLPLSAQPVESGPITIGGSAHVQGPATIHGPLIVDGYVHARGPLTAAWFSGPTLGYAGRGSGPLLKVFHGPLTVHGAMVVHGDLRVDGPLTVDGPVEAGMGIDADGPMRERGYAR